MLYRIKLELARTPEHPEGDPEHGYDFIAPLDKTGMLDPSSWRDQRKQCTVRRFAPGEDDETGHLIHTQGRQWAFHYEEEDVEDEAEESGFKFSSHSFQEGDYVSITENDGETRTFKVYFSKPAKI